MTYQTCPLCKNQAAVVPPAGAVMNQMYVVTCDTCGNYKASDWIVEHPGVVQESIGNDAYLLSSATRKALERSSRSNGRSPLAFLKTDNLVEIVNATRPRPGIIPIADSFLLFLSEVFGSFSNFYDLTSRTDYTLAACRNQSEFVIVMNYLTDARFLKERNGRTFTENSDMEAQLSFRITPAGYERIRDLQKTTKGDIAFVAMWFDEKQIEVQNAYDDAIKKAIIETTKLKCIRADKEHHNDDINDWILGQIRRSAFMVADFTGNRGGVYLETGFAMGLGIPVILTCMDSDHHKKALYFDTNHRNHIFWKDSDSLYKALSDRIKATIPIEYLK